jgi:hypothetical protein
VNASKMDARKNSIGRHGRVKMPAHVSCRQFDEELVMLDLQRGEYFSLNGTGARIWRDLVGGASPSEIAASLASEYAIPQEDVLHDCVLFVDDLLERGLLERTSL